MSLDRDHLHSIEQFFGADWLQKGSEKYRRKLEQGARRGFVDDRAKHQTHPVVQLWYKNILGQPEPADWVLAGQAKLDGRAQEIHRMLHLEFLLKELMPGWNAEELQEVRERLMNSPQFAATLCELSVLANFRRTGYDFRLMTQKGKSGRIPDISGRVGDTPIRVECKRLSAQAEHRRKRNRAWKNEAEALAKELRRQHRTGIVMVEYFDEPGSTDVDTALELLNDALNLGRPYVREASGRFAIHLHLQPVQDAPEIKGLSSAWREFDLLHVDGVREITDHGARFEKLVAIGFVFRPPTDWSGGVLRILREAHKKFKRKHCNIVCLEIADLPSFRSLEEFGLVFTAIERFLARDTQRVSCVVLTVYGIKLPSQGIYETVTESKVFLNWRAYVPLPKQFELPKFAWPSHRVRVSTSE